MGFNGEGYVIAMALLALWVASSVVLLALLRRPRTGPAEIVLWVCFAVQIGAAIRAFQIDLAPFGLVALGFVLCAVLVLRRWSAAG